MGFLRACLLSLLCTSAAYLGLAWLVNPRGELGPSLFPEIIPNIRAEKIALFEAYDRQAPVVGIVLGSSRTMKLPPALFEARTGLRFFNFGVHAAIPQDYLAIYHYLRLRGARPKLVVLGLELNAFHPENAAAYDFESNLVLRSALSGQPTTGLERWLHRATLLKRAFTPSYVLDIGKSVEVVLRPIDPYARYEPDGRMVYLRWEREIRSGTFAREKLVDDCLAGEERSFRTYDREDEVQVRYLGRLLDEATADGTTIVLWLTPLHPRLAQALDESPLMRANLSRARARLEELAKAHGVRLVDLARAEAYGGDATGWYDCVHYSDSDAAKIVDALVAHGL